MIRLLYHISFTRVNGWGIFTRAKKAIRRTAFFAFSYINFIFVETSVVLFALLRHFSVQSEAEQLRFVLGVFAAKSCLCYKTALDDLRDSDESRQTGFQIDAVAFFAFEVYVTCAAVERLDEFRNVNFVHFNFSFDHNFTAIPFCGIFVIRKRAPEDTYSILIFQNSARAKFDELSKTVA